MSDIFKVALLMAIFAVLGTSLVATTHSLTEQRIKDNEKNALLNNLHSLIPPIAHDNDLFNDTMTISSPELLGTPDDITVYRARFRTAPVAMALHTVAPDGYNGKIKLLVAIRYDGVVIGVRVISHKETPGLGDRIEADRSDWIKQFKGKSFSNPEKSLWKVKKDGGVFDQFTGATITPRAVVKAVANCLVLFHTYKEQLFREDEEF
ncbi:MAG: electron transport complex subunit RsxG [Gammaproteobacteria bacterium]|nr:MAG: electron transport complex subunit RsxG [Gammaproteobacteria bacterium]